MVYILMAHTSKEMNTKVVLGRDRGIYVSTNSLYQLLRIIA